MYKYTTQAAETFGLSLMSKPNFLLTFPFYSAPKMIPLANWFSALVAWNCSSKLRWDPGPLRTRNSSRPQSAPFGSAHWTKTTSEGKGRHRKRNSFLQWTGNEPKCKQKISVLLCEESNSSQFQFRSRLLCHLSCHKHLIVACGNFFTVYFQVYFQNINYWALLSFYFTRSA